MLPFPTFIDSTMLNDYRLCEQKWAWRYLYHLIPATPNVHLNAGGAIAKGLEVARCAFYERGLSQEDSVALGLEALLTAYGAPEETEQKSWDQTAGAFIFYCDQRPFASDHLQPFIANGKATVEFSASIPIPINNPQTGDPILYTGRFDMLARHEQLDNKQAFCVDEKTMERLDGNLATKWALRGQFIGYVWLSQASGYDVAGTIVRGLVMHKYDYQLIEIPLYTSRWKIDAWYEGMVKTAEDMVRTWKACCEAESARPFVKAMNDACGMYNGCAYIRLCDSQKWEMWKTPYYIEREWDPIKREEI